MKLKDYILCKYKVILIGILLFHLINNYIWLKLDKAYLQFDSHWHFLSSLKAFELIKKFSFFSLLFNLEQISPYWHGVFVSYITAPFYFIFGTSQDAGVMINAVIFLSILVFSTYGIGRRLYDRKVGLLAAFIVTMYPVIFNQLRLYMLDLPLAAMVTLGIYLLLCSDNFKDKKYSLLFGITIGLGLLTKFSFTVFIIGPLCIILYRALTQRKKDKDIRQILINLALLLIIILSISSAFYIIKFKYILFRITTPWIKVPFNRLPSFYLGSLLIYSRILINNTISFVFFVIFSISLLFFITKKRMENKFLLLSPIVIPLFFLIFIYHIGISEHMSRYSMPFLPFIAIISAAGLTSIRCTRLKKTLISFVIVLSIIQFFAISYGIGQLPQKIEVRIPDSILGVKNRWLKNIILFNQNIEIIPRISESSHPSACYWENKELLNELMKIPDGYGVRVTVSFIDLIPEVSEPIIYQVLVDKSPIDIRCILLAIDEFHKVTQFFIYRLVLSSNYVIVKEKEDWIGHFHALDTVREDVTEARVIFYRNIERFELIKEFPLPENNKLLLYRNRLNFAEIEYASLRLLFNNGLVKLYYKDVELTKESGLISGFSYQSELYDSSQAIWQVEKANPNELTATACWPGIPIKQTWHFILKDNQIDWQIELETEKEIELENLQARIFLKSDYKNWLNLYDTGSLPKLFPWQRYAQIKIQLPTSLIGLNLTRTKEGLLPAIFVNLATEQLLNKASIRISKNAESKSASSVIRIHNLEEKLLLSQGNHSLLSSKISLFDKEEEINSYIEEQRKRLFILIRTPQI